MDWSETGVSRSARAMIRSMWARPAAWLVGGEGVAQGRVMVIHGAHEVLEEHQRKTSGDPETAVREAYPAALHVLGQGRVLPAGPA